MAPQTKPSQCCQFSKRNLAKFEEIVKLFDLVPYYWLSVEPEMQEAEGRMIGYSGLPRRHSAAQWSRLASAAAETSLLRRQGLCSTSAIAPSSRKLGPNAEPHASICSSSCVCVWFQCLQVIIPSAVFVFKIYKDLHTFTALRAQYFSKQHVYWSINSTFRV